MIYFSPQCFISHSHTKSVCFHGDNIHVCACTSHVLVTLNRFLSNVREKRRIPRQAEVRVGK